MLAWRSDWALQGKLKDERRIPNHSKAPLLEIESASSHSASPYEVRQSCSAEQILSKEATDSILRKVLYQVEPPVALLAVPNSALGQR